MRLQVRNVTFHLWTTNASLILILGDGDQTFSEKCQVDKEFSNNNYKTSPDGDFTFKLRNDKTQLDYNKVKKLLVEIRGSYIPFKEIRNADTPATLFL